MGFKIKPFYGGSPLHSSSPDRPFSAGDTKRKTKKANKTSQQIVDLQNKRSSVKNVYLGDPDDLQGEMVRTADKPASKREKRKVKKLAKTKDQLKRNASGDKTPLRMEDAKLMAMKKQAAQLKKEIAAMRAESKKTGKVTNWDDKADQLSRLNEQIAAYKPKKS
jgi:hypothetical protein